MPSFWGSPGTTNLIQTRGTAPVKPPGFGFAQWLFSQLPQLMNTPFPTYQGQLDPGLSPTMQDVIRRAQGFGQSSAPEILGGVQGTLGRFMAPRMVNPWTALYGGGGSSMGAGAPGSSFAGMYGANTPATFGNAPNYFGVDPSQRVYGGQPASSFTWQGGMPQAPSQQPQQPQQTMQWPGG